MRQNHKWGRFQNGVSTRYTHAQMHTEADLQFHTLNPWVSIIYAPLHFWMLMPHSVTNFAAVSVIFGKGYHYSPDKNFLLSKVSTGRMSPVLRFPLSSILERHFLIFQSLRVPCPHPSLTHSNTQIALSPSNVIKNSYSYKSFSVSIIFPPFLTLSA